MIRMGTVNVIVIVESVQSLATTKSDSLKEFHIPSIAAVSAALGRSFSCDPGAADDMSTPGVKFLLFLYCYTLRKKSSQVHMLWEDHRNDLFLNVFGMAFRSRSFRDRL
jgi:hypothetical protein